VSRTRRVSDSCEVWFLGTFPGDTFEESLVPRDTSKESHGWLCSNEELLQAYCATFFCGEGFLVDDDALSHKRVVVQAVEAVVEEQKSNYE